ncbi:MAG: deoxyribonuclease V [Actinomycetota bacterium]|nr:deoxyribonuclease V [Actinomycetota bacterium]
MRVKVTHELKLTPREAASLQARLASKVEREPALSLERVRYVAGADVSYSKGARRGFSSVVIMDFPGLQVVEERVCSCAIDFPYVPGLLSFREIPALIPALEEIRTIPDVLLVDGQGLAHPRRIGIASHLGLFLDIPTIGVAKSLLVGEYEMPGLEKGSVSPLLDKEERVGTVLRSRSGVKPIFVSIGNRIDLESAIKVVLACCRSSRIPDPIKRAHVICNLARQQ